MHTAFSGHDNYKRIQRRLVFGCIWLKLFCWKCFNRYSNEISWLKLPIPYVSMYVPMPTESGISLPCPLISTPGVWFPVCDACIWVHCQRHLLAPLKDSTQNYPQTTVSSGTFYVKRDVAIYDDSLLFSNFIHSYFLSVQQYYNMR